MVIITLRLCSAQGYEYCFISNIDNLGATVDVNILELLIKSKLNEREYVIELTEKTRADVKVSLLKLFYGDWLVTGPPFVESFRLVAYKRLCGSGTWWSIYECGPKNQKFI